MIWVSMLTRFVLPVLSLFLSFLLYSSPAHLKDEVFGSAYAAAIYLSRVSPLTPARPKVFLIGESGLESELRAAGISFICGTDPSFNIAPRLITIIAKSMTRRSAQFHVVSTERSRTRSPRVHSRTSIRRKNEGKKRR